MKFLKQIVLCIVLILVAGYVWVTQVPSAASYLDRFGLADMLGLTPSAAAEDGARRGGGAVRVVAAEVTEGVIDDRLETIGDGRARHSVALRAEVAGTVVALPVEDGAFVEQGDVIVQLDDEAQQIALERARVTVIRAQEDVNRLSQLSDSVSAVRLREARLTLQTAELALRQAEFDLSQSTLRAPLSGWLGFLDLGIGDRVSSQDQIGTITDRSAILIDFRVPERAVSQISEGMAIMARPLGQPGVELTGQVRAIDAVVDRESRTLRVQGLVENDDDRLRAGMAFTVVLSFQGEALPAVDPLSVQWASDGSFVWALRDGAAVQVPITIRQRNAASVVVEADLAPGDLVVTEGVQNLRPGAEVEVVDPDQLSARASGREEG